MKVVTTLHQPSAVLSSLTCNLSSNSELGHLVAAKSNRIEVSSLRSEGLEPECSLEIWGRVLCVRAVPSEVCLIIMLKGYMQLTRSTDRGRIQCTRANRPPRSETNSSEI